MITQQTDTGIDQRLVKAMGHPLRQRILIALNRRVSSPNQLANELGEPLGNVSYHVKVLAECEAIELVDTRPVRGAVEHFYRATMRNHFDDRHWESLPLSMRRALFGQTLQQIWKHAGEAADAGGFDDPEDHVSWTVSDLDDEGFRDMVEHVNEALERALQIQEESVNRRAAAGEAESIRTEFVLMHFHRPNGASA
jgi:DNA-binding transcriptional ArsR family regulator